MSICTCYAMQCLRRDKYVTKGHDGNNRVMLNYLKNYLSMYFFYCPICGGSLPK